MERVYPFDHRQIQKIMTGGRGHRVIRGTMMHCVGQVVASSDGNGCVYKYSVVGGLRVSPRKILINLTSECAFCDTLGHIEYLD